MKFLIALLVLLLNFPLLAQTRIVSIDAFDVSYTGGFSYLVNKGDEDDRDETKFRLNLNYAQNFGDYEGLMWKGQLSFNRTDVDFGSDDTLESTYGLGAGLIYNLQPEDIKNSFMVAALAGLERASYEIGNLEGQSGFNFFFNIEGGKRWDMGQYSAANISYAPTVALHLKRFGGDLRNDYYKTGYELRVNFLKFDVLF